MSLFSKFTPRRHCPACDKNTGHHVGDVVESAPAIGGPVYDYSVCTRCGLLDKHDRNRETPALTNWYKQWPYARKV